MKRYILLPTTSFLIGCVLTAVSFPAEPSPEPNAPQPPPLKEPRERQAERLILERLEAVADWEVDKMTLVELEAELRKRLGVNVILDRRELEDVGIDRDLHTVSGNFKQVSYRAMLEALLKQCELDWTVRYESLYITSPQVVEYQMSVRVYNVADLVGNDEFYGTDFEPFVLAITNTIAPETWDDMGGPGSIAPYETRGLRVIIVAQTPEVHLRLEQLLFDLRRELGTAEIKPHPAKVKFDALRGSPLLHDDSSEDDRPSAQENETSSRRDSFKFNNCAMVNALAPRSNSAEQGNRLETNHLFGLAAAERRDAARRANEFSFALYRELAAREPKGNLVVSGHAVRNAAALLSFGAADAARAALCERLGLPLDRERAAAELLYLQPHISPNRESKRTHERNALWVDESIAVDDDFAHFARALLDASVETADFQKRERTMDAVQAWRAVESPRPVEGGVQWPASASSPSGRAVFVAGFDYWRYRFSYPRGEELEQNAGLPLAEFRVSKEETAQVPTDLARMHARLSLRADLGMDVVELPNRNGNVSLLIFVPAKTIDVPDPLAQLEESLSHDFFERQLRTLRQMPIGLSLPRIAFASSFLLSLEGDDAAADDAPFPRISRSLAKMPAIAHHATVDIGDPGERERLTRYYYNFGIGYFNYPSIQADRPFLFMLYDRGTGCILLMGRVMNP